MDPGDTEAGMPDGAPANDGTEAPGPPRPSSSRRRRRADGTLRPTVVRRRQRIQKKRKKLSDDDPARQAWLANFAPGARREFFDNTLFSEAVFLSAFVSETGLERAAAADFLARTADERGWLKLATLDGTVVGIAPPRPPKLTTMQKKAVRLLRRNAFTIGEGFEGAGREIIHACSAGYAIMLGADWDLATAIEFVETAQGIQWVDHPLRHDLAVKGADGRVVYFDIRSPQRDREPPGTSGGTPAGTLAQDGVGGADAGRSGSTLPSPPEPL